MFVLVVAALVLAALVGADTIANSLQTSCETSLAVICPKWQEMNAVGKLQCLVSNEEMIGGICYDQLASTFVALNQQQQNDDDACLKAILSPREGTSSCARVDADPLQLLNCAASEEHESVCGGQDQALTKQVIRDSTLRRLQCCVPGFACSSPPHHHHHHRHHHVPPPPPCHVCRRRKAAQGARPARACRFPWENEDEDKPLCTTARARHHHQQEPLAWPARFATEFSKLLLLFSLGAYFGRRYVLRQQQPRTATSSAALYDPLVLQQHDHGENKA